MWTQGKMSPFGGKAIVAKIATDGNNIGWNVDGLQRIMTVEGTDSNAGDCI
jgi:hypothetical protein